MNLVPYSCYAHTVLDCAKGPFSHKFLDKSDAPSCHLSDPPNPIIGMIIGEIRVSVAQSCMKVNR